MPIVKVTVASFMDQSGPLSGVLTEGLERSYAGDHTRDRQGFEGAAEINSKFCNVPGKEGYWCDYV